MSPRKKTTSVTLGDKSYEILQALASSRTEALRLEGSTHKIYMGDIIREAVEEYLRQRGFDVDIDVDRGGYRGEKSADTDV